KLAIIGDVHGCIKELNALIAEIGKEVAGKVHYIFVGDLVAKGPQSAEVVAKAIELRASCIRGNHDQRVISSQYLLGQDESADTLGTAMPDGLDIKEQHQELAKSLSSDALDYLRKCPLAIKLPAEFKGTVVHAGVNPTRSLKDQASVDLMTMRNMDGSKAVENTKDGAPWFEEWDQAVASGSMGADFKGFEKIYYGHAAGRGLQVHGNSVGLDSACVTGGKLTAAILPGDKLVSVPCKAY
ncbi:Ser/Thr protein phosphatase family protein, partial [Dimargaris cristalligena]